MDHDLIVVGGGIAGLTACIYASCSGLDVLCLENQVCGGQIVNTPKIINYPGIPEIDGMSFVQNLQKQAADLGTNIQFEQISSMDLAGGSKIFKTNNNEYANRYNRRRAAEAKVASAEEYEKSF